MTLADTIALVKQFLSYDLDTYLGDNPQDTQFVGSINWSIRTLAKKAKLFGHSIPLQLVAGQSSYPMRSIASDGSRVTKIDEVIFNNMPLRAANSRFQGTWSLDELQNAYPSWRSTTAGSPILAALSGTDVILYPAPNASAVALGGHYIIGNFMPADVTDTTKQLPLPIELHEAVAYLAACRLATPTATEDSQYQRLKAFSTEWEDAIDEIRTDNINASANWGTTYGEIAPVRYL